jgi:hypothetical protein
VSQPTRHDPVDAALSRVLAELEAAAGAAAEAEGAERSREPADPAARAAAEARLLALQEAIALVGRHRLRHRDEAVHRLAAERDRAAWPPRRSSSQPAGEDRR